MFFGGELESRVSTYGLAQARAERERCLSLGGFCRPLLQPFFVPPSSKATTTPHRRRRGTDKTATQPPPTDPQESLEEGEMGGLLLLLRIEEKELHFWDLRLNHGERRGSRLDFASVVGGRWGGETRMRLCGKGDSMLALSGNWKELSALCFLSFSFFCWGSRWGNWRRNIF